MPFFGFYKDKHFVGQRPKNTSIAVAVHKQMAFLIFQNVVLTFKIYFPIKNLNLNSPQTPDSVCLCLWPQANGHPERKYKHSNRFGHSREPK